MYHIIEQILLGIWKHIPKEMRRNFDISCFVHMLQDISAVIKLQRTESCDYHGLVDGFLKTQGTLERLLSIPHIPQRSEEWLNLRKNMLTASDLAQALGKGKFGTRNALLQKKALALCNEYKPPVKEEPGYFGSMAPMKWGTMFEPMISRIYSERNGNIMIHDFGLLKHPSLMCFGASPDGITETGKMVEIKCPWKRKIDTGVVPEQYLLQIQGQLAVCGLYECDYIEVVMENIDGEEAYYVMVPEEERTEHGMILELQMPDGQETYEYSPPRLNPKEAYAWAKTRAWEIISEQPDINIMRLRPWKVQSSNTVTIRFDEALWNSLVPHIEQFWKDVIELRDKYDASVNVLVQNETETTQPQGSTKRIKKTKLSMMYREENEEEL